jgi:uncharacterized protein
MLLLVVSPAKSLNTTTPLPAAAQGLAVGEPAFAAQAGQIMARLKKLSPGQVGQLMELSDKLATLNAQRYAAWSAQPAPDATRPSLFTFDGDVYGGIDAYSLKAPALKWLQTHLLILSGLYGVLRPMDALQPYRLEMGTAVSLGRGVPNLYRFWGDTLARHINQLAADQPAAVLVNLASQEYFKAIDLKALALPVVECVFQERKPGGAHKVVSFNAKRARGLMARWCAQHRPSKPQALQGFADERYAWDAEASTAERYVFRRDVP